MEKEISNSVTRSNFVSNLMKTQQKLMKNWKMLIESMLYQGHRFLGGIKHFWMAVRMWKTNLVLEDLARQKRTKMWQKRGISWGLIDVWQNDQSRVEFESPNCPRNFDLRTGHAENLCQAGPKNSYQWTEGKLKECVPGPSWTHRKRHFFLNMS